jgi:hypothetical protein
MTGGAVGCGETVGEGVLPEFSLQMHAMPDE